MTIFEHFLAAIATGDDNRTELLVAQLAVADVSALSDLARSSDSEQRWWAARALADLATNVVNAPLLALAEDADAGVRTAAIMALGQVTKRKVQAAEDLAALQNILTPILTAVAGHLADEDGSVRQAAMETMALGGENSLPILAQVLEGVHEGARTRAAMALRRMKSQSAAGLLYRCLNDTNYMVHTYAYEALDELGLLETMLVAV